MRVRLLAALALLLFGLAGVLSQGHDPGVAAGKMTVPPEFTVSLVASEPLVRQPVAIDFDDRGRSWVMQYLQYPNPAGLKRQRVDRYSRTVYDRVPEPPPRGPRGADRLTILHDPDRAGRMRRSHDFVSGLNLASAFAFGHGGVFVLQVPYLLFYPDRDGDDRPDDDPDVLLSGFGMEDAHSVANSLTWGPDGWLYGCQGSTVTANVRGIEFQQGVWRYHPITRRFELFCEGGGNSWGLDFDRHGNLLYSTNHGGFVLLHGVQGGYYWKAFGKHGPLHNPFTFGYFDHVPHTSFTGGHVTVGGIVYRGDSFPQRFRDRYVAADLLGHDVYWHDVEPAGSSFRTRHGGRLLRSNDTWFAPSDVAMAPDGSVHVADWHDQRTAHPDPDATWDRSNGRIYRIAAKGTKPYEMGDLRKRSSMQLVELLGQKNDWLVRRARRILADRRDPEVILPLRETVRTSTNDQLALEALWALYVSGGVSEAFTEELLAHRNPHLRRWAIRFLGDDQTTTAPLARRLADLASREPSVAVRSQLASSAKRFPPAIGLPIIWKLLEHDDRGDPHLPLLLWWAVERHALPALTDVVGFFSAPDTWKTPLAREVLLPRLVRRLAAAGSTAALAGCARLLASAPAAHQARLLAALDDGLGDGGGDRGKLPAPLVGLLDRLWRDDTTDVVLIRLHLRLDRSAARRRALVLAGDFRVASSLRAAMLRALGEVDRGDVADPLLKLLGDKAPDEVRLAALEALARDERVRIGTALLESYPGLTGRLRARARGALLGRKAWASLFVTAVEKKQIDPREVSADELQTLALHRDTALETRVRRLWGSIQPPTPEEKLAIVRRLGNDLRAGAGDRKKGRETFGKLCGLCHKLHGEGGTLGPDLTHANRKDRQYLLVSIVDPSAVIRKEYLSHTATMKDGRVFTGLMVEQMPGHVTLVDGRNEKVKLARNRIESLEESPMSLMPERLLESLDPQGLRDLFAYLEADRPR